MIPLGQKTLSDRRTRSGFSFLRSVLIVAVFLTVFLSGCGEAADTSGLSGTYQLLYADSQMQRWTLDTGLALPILIRLDADGSGAIQSGEDQGRIRWGVQNGSLEIRADDLLMKGGLEANGFFVRFSDNSPALHFERSNGTFPEAEAEAAAADSLPGEWYGWWRIQNSTGVMPDTWYDCCAAMQVTGKDELLVVLWDENGSRSEPLSEVRMQLQEDGRLLSLGGYFLYDTVEYGQWSLPADSSVFYLENILHEGDGESFQYTVYMKPWGTVWSDSPADQLPFYYEDWYLQNRRAEMPERIPWEKIEAKRAGTAAP